MLTASLNKTFYLCSCVGSSVVVSIILHSKMKPDCSLVKNGNQYRMALPFLTSNPVMFIIGNNMSAGRPKNVVLSELLLK